jgi:cytochrome c peroxidase
LVRTLARRLTAVLALAAVAALATIIVNGSLAAFAQGGKDARKKPSLVADGKQIFRFDTFGDQAFWGDALQLHKAIEGAKLGGVGPGVSPKTALAVGLKVDVKKLPDNVREGIKSGKVDLDDPATTLALLKLNAVVGVQGFFDSSGRQLTSMGITCAFCHSTVDDSFAPGIGERRDGWPNRDLNVGAIISLSPDLTPFTSLLRVDAATVKKVLAAWGPGKFDAELALDGQGFRPDGRTAATLIPPAYGLAGVNLHTFTGWGSVPYWNAFVANLDMHGIGNFSDARLADASKFPVAARAGFAHVTHSVDLITSKLPALHAYQLSLPAPTPDPGSFDAAAATRGKEVFDGPGKCASCHMPPIFTDSGWNLHTPAEICTDAFTANRSPTGMYRTTPLRGVSTHGQGGYYHDGRFATLDAVVAHYNSCMSLGLSTGQQADLVQYLKSL